jgi:hypothetical protein
MHGAHCVPLCPPYEPDGTPEARGIHSGGPAGDGMGPALCEDAVRAAGCCVAVLYRLALEWPGLETETSTHR